MKLNVYGTLIEISRKERKWIVYYLGNEGKKRVAQDIHIPSEINKESLIEYIADLCHEWAKPNSRGVYKID
jgi:hypothetical protein